MSSNSACNLHIVGLSCTLTSLPLSCRLWSSGLMPFTLVKPQISAMSSALAWQSEHCARYDTMSVASFDSGCCVGTETGELGVTVLHWRPPESLLPLASATSVIGLCCTASMPSTSPSLTLKHDRGFFKCLFYFSFFSEQTRCLTLRTCLSK